VNSLGAGSELLGKTAREFGLPAWDIVWARRGTQAAGLELSGDNPWPAEDRAPSAPGNQS
jgi:hypothetical protein